MSFPHDTLDDIDTSGVRTLYDLYRLLFGNIQAQDGVCGDLLCGPVKLHAMDRFLLGFWGRTSIRCAGHDCDWFVRSSGKFRIGKPLDNQETRLVSIMSRNSTGVVAHVASFHLRLVRWATDRDAQRSIQVSLENPSERESISDEGVATLHLFENHISSSPIGTEFTEGRDGFHLIAGSFTTRVDSCFLGTSVPRNATSHGIYPTTAALLGTSYFCLRNPSGVRQISSVQANSEKQIFMKTMTNEFKETLTKEQSEMIVLGAFEAAYKICENCSLLGYLDRLSNPFFRSTLPADFMSPCGIRLVLVVAMRIAMIPERLGLNLGTANDRVASATFLSMLESVMTPIAGRHGEINTIMYAIDVVLEKACRGIRSKEMAGADRANMVRASELTINTLYKAGMNMLLDIAGPKPITSGSPKKVVERVVPFPPGAIGDRSAPKLQSCVADARTEMLWQNGLGRTEGIALLKPCRTSTVDARQHTAITNFIIVEMWLKSGMFQGEEMLVPTKHSTHIDSFGQGSAPPPKNVQFTERKQKKKTRKVQKTASSTMDSEIDEHVVGCLNAHAVTVAQHQLMVMMNFDLPCGLAHMFDFKTFLVSSKSYQPCCNCSTKIWVAEFFGFFNSKSHCIGCNGMMCLRCQRALEPALCMQCDSKSK